MIQLFQKHLSNLLGWRTTRKIVVFESDDWGSIRMPSLKVYDYLRSKGLNLSSGDNNRFNTLDTLASANDFDALFATLRKHRDKHGRHPVITAMSLSTNPDFDRIRSEGFTQYFWETVPSTLQRYSLADAWNFWQQGERENLFFPEFHGREHLNVAVWMKDIQDEKGHARIAFDQGFWGFRNINTSGISYQAAFDVDVANTILLQREIISSGLKIFQELHNRRAKFFVPPNGLISQSTIDNTVEEGIQYVSSPKIYKEPLGSGKNRRRFRYLGMKGYKGMIYLTRNCFFEPSYTGKGFSAKDCLSHIRNSFSYGKPAIISTHRVNYVGGLQDANRLNGNEALNKLLKSILINWPDVEFMTSTQLGDLIRHDKK